MNIKKLKFYILVVLSALSLVLILFSTILGYNPDRFSFILQTYGVPELLFISWVILATATTLPVSAVMIAGIIYFSFFYAMAYTFIGMLIGSIGTFYASRWLGKDFVKEAVGLKGKGRIHILNQLIHKHSLAYVILLAFVYAFPSNLAYMIGGVTDIKFKDMLLIIIFGNLTTALGVGWIILGAVNSGLEFILGGAALILIVNVIPLAMYWGHLRKLVVLAYSEKAYRKLVRAEKMIKNDYGIPLPKKRQV